MAAMTTILIVAAVLGLWQGEPRGQEYALQHGELVLFWIPDERRPAFGTAFYLWGYVPVIVSDGRSFRFRDVEWTRGEL